ncbi:MAG: hypothetical protein SFW63_08165 [Alphaproteobacteria bacterium]|nr:hypothetical protein [Alphaproteobacteria bacterium]
MATDKEQQFDAALISELRREITELSRRQQVQDRILSQQGKTLLDVARQILVMTSGGILPDRSQNQGAPRTSRGQGMAEAAAAIMRALRRHL